MPSRPLSLTSQLESRPLKLMIWTPLTRLIQPVCQSHRDQPLENALSSWSTMLMSIICSGCHQRTTSYSQAWTRTTFLATAKGSSTLRLCRLSRTLIPIFSGLSLFVPCLVCATLWSKKHASKHYARTTDTQTWVASTRNPSSERLPFI